MTSEVRQLVWHTMLLGQHDPCGLSHSHSRSGTKAEDQTSSDGTCCNFFLPTRSPHEGSHVRRGSPDTIILKNMGHGWRSFGGLTVWPKHRQGTRELMGGVMHNETLHRGKIPFWFRNCLRHYYRLHRLLLRPVNIGVWF